RRGLRIGHEPGGRRRELPPRPGFPDARVTEHGRGRPGPPAGTTGGIRAPPGSGWRVQTLITEMNRTESNRSDRRAPGRLESVVRARAASATAPPELSAVIALEAGDGEDWTVHVSGGRMSVAR